MVQAMTARSLKSAARRVAGCLLALLTAACASLSTVAPQAGTAAPQAALMQAPPPQVDPAPYDPAGAWTARAALALSTLMPGAIVTADADPTQEGEPVQAPALDATQAQAVQAVEASAGEVAPAMPLAQSQATANLPMQPASAAVKAQGNLVTMAVPRINAAPPPIARAPEPALDVKALKLRLRETGGIGVFDKLTLKRELDNLLSRLRSHHESGQANGIAQLRAPFNALVQKVLAALRDGDPDLARVILASREAIWAILSDPVKFFAAN